MADFDVMAVMVEENITDPSRPVKRRIDELLLICRAMMREKDRQITVLKEQVEDLTKKNNQLRNTLIDTTKKMIDENVRHSLNITEETARIEQQKSVQAEMQTIEEESELDKEIEDTKHLVDKSISELVNIDANIKIEISEFDNVTEDTQNFIEKSNSELIIFDDTVLIKTEIEIHEHDINDAINVTRVTEEISDVDTLQNKKEMEPEEERRDVDIEVL
ncbi:uncharacterized protein ACR2FA_009184 [Aphomia sociella]